MAPKMWIVVACWSFVAVMGELCFGFGFAFNPGWANRWPFGLKIHSVWSTWMSLHFFLLLMTAAIGVGAVPCAAISFFDFGRRHSRRVYTVWLIISTVAAAVGSLWAFWRIYASALEMWPNGYNP